MTDKQCDCEHNDAKDAARFRYLQNIPVVEAQAFFWRFTSRRERRKQIDDAIYRARLNELTVV